MCLKVFYCSNKVFSCLFAVQLFEKFSDIGDIFRSTAYRGKCIRGKSKKALVGHSSCNILNMRHQASVFMDNDHCRKFLSFLGSGKICPHFTCCSRIFDELCYQRWFCLGFACCQEIIFLKYRHQCQCSSRTSCDKRKLFQKIAARCTAFPVIFI